jgi:O-antigen/teichoic acid export membrane protein
MSSPALIARRFGYARLLPRLTRDEVIRDGTVLAASAGFSSLLMLLYQVLVAREIQPAAYATFGALLGIIAIVSQVGNGFQLTAARDVARLSGSADDAAVHRYIVSSVRWSVIQFVVLLVVLLPFTPLIGEGLGISSDELIVMAIVVGAGYLPLSTLRGNLQGLQKFGALSKNRIGEKAVLIISGGSLVMAGFGIDGAMLGLVISLVAMAAYAAVTLGPYGKSLLSGVRPGQMVKPSVIVMVTALGVAALANMDSLIAKSIFDDEDAGVFNAVGRLGKVMFFIALAFNRALFPKSTRLRASGGNSFKLLLKGLAFMAFGSLIVIPMTIPVARPFMSFALGHAYAGSSGLVPWYFTAMSLMAMVSMVLYYNVAVGNRVHVAPMAVGLAVMAGMFVVQPGTMFHLIAAMIAVYIGLLAVALFSTVRSELPRGGTGRAPAPPGQPAG